MEALVGERELPTVGLISLCVQRINRTQTGVSKMRFVHLRHALFMRLKFVLIRRPAARRQTYKREVYVASKTEG
jgi:hypothetical protein